MKKVRCLRKPYTFMDLTIGKVYEVIRENRAFDTILIKDDTGYDNWYVKDDFEIVEGEDK